MEPSTPETPAMPPSDHQALEFVRDALNSLRTDVGKVYDKINNFVDVNAELHARIDARLAKLETCNCSEKTASPMFAKLPWLPMAIKIGWPVALLMTVLWTRATPETRNAATSIAAEAAGLPKGVVTYPTPTSSTYVAPRTSGGR